MEKLQEYSQALEFFGKLHCIPADYADEIKNVFELSNEEKRSPQHTIAQIYDVLQTEIMKNAYPPVVYTDIMSLELLEKIKQEFLTMQTNLQKLGKDLYPLQQQKLQIVQDLLAKRTGNQ